MSIPGVFAARDRSKAVPSALAIGTTGAGALSELSKESSSVVRRFDIDGWKAEVLRRDIH